MSPEAKPNDRPAKGPSKRPAKRSTTRASAAQSATKDAPSGRPARRRRPARQAPPATQAQEAPRPPTQTAPGSPRPTRQAPRPTPETASKAPATARPLDDPEKAREAMQAAAAGAIHGDRLKKPSFAPAKVARPEAVDREERRRLKIFQEEQQRRKELWEAAEGDDEERARLKERFAAEDAARYVPDKDDQEVALYPIREPYAYVQIVENSRTHQHLYHVIEPQLTHQERLLLKFIEETMLDVLDVEPGDLDPAGLEKLLEEAFDEVVGDYNLQLVPEGERTADRQKQLEEEARERMLYHVLRDFLGEGPLDVLIRDGLIEDISCDGPHQPIFVYHREYESLPTTIRFQDHEELDAFVIRLAQRAGKHVSIAEPILDATMLDGSRLQATLAKEVSAFGSTFTIRKFRETPFSPIDLVRFGTIDAHILAYLWMVIQHGQSALVAGGTASGKTTATNAILQFIPPQMKVVSIEDTRELQLPQPNWIAGVTRGGFGPRDSAGRQAGEIDMFQLLKNALRQRPEYIVVGEVRGQEAYNLFQAMATGHAAYGTLHADSVDAVIHRLESDPINLPRPLLEALDVVAVQQQTRVGGKRVRRMKSVTEIVGLDPNTREILTNEVFRWDPSEDRFIDSGVSYSLQRIAVETGQTEEDVQAEMERRQRVLTYLLDREMTDYETIANVIATFYRDPDRVMAYVQEGRPWPQA
ncbi:MAG: ATPase, T2SS/T4P/T4SS family [Thermoplasmatota archaeon]